MNEWASNPQWWISTTVAAVIGVMIPKIYRGLGAWLLSGAKGKLLKGLRHQKYKRLKKIKSKRFDSVAINREITLNYALFVVFASTAIGTLAAVINLPFGSHLSHTLTIAISLLMALPALAFEVAWLTVSSSVDDLLKYRKRIKRVHRGLY